MMELDAASADMYQLPEWLGKDLVRQVHFVVTEPTTYAENYLMGWRCYNLNETSPFPGLFE